MNYSGSKIKTDQLIEMILRSYTYTYYNIEYHIQRITINSNVTRQYKRKLSEQN